MEGIGELIGKRKEMKELEILRCGWVGLSLSPSLVRAEGSTVEDPGGKFPPSTFPSNISLSSTITGKTAHC